MKKFFIIVGAVLASVVHSPAPPTLGGPTLSAGGGLSSNSVYNMIINYGGGTNGGGGGGGIVSNYVGALTGVIPQTNSTPYLLFVNALVEGTAGNNFKLETDQAADGVFEFYAQNIGNPGPTNYATNTLSTYVLPGGVWKITWENVGGSVLNGSITYFTTNSSGGSGGISLTDATNAAQTVVSSNNAYFVPRSADVVTNNYTEELSLQNSLNLNGNILIIGVDDQGLEGGDIGEMRLRSTILLGDFQGAGTFTNLMFVDNLASGTSTNGYFVWSYTTNAIGRITASPNWISTNLSADIINSGTFTGNGAGLSNISLSSNTIVAYFPPSALRVVGTGTSQGSSVSYSAAPHYFSDFWQQTSAASGTFQFGISIEPDVTNVVVTYTWSSGLSSGTAYWVDTWTTYYNVPEGRAGGVSYTTNIFCNSGTNTTTIISIPLPATNAWKQLNFSAAVSTNTNTRLIPFGLLLKKSRL